MQQFDAIFEIFDRAVFEAVEVTLFVNESILDINYLELLTPDYQYMI